MDLNHDGDAHSRDVESILRIDPNGQELSSSNIRQCLQAEIHRRILELGSGGLIPLQSSGWQTSFLHSSYCAVVTQAYSPFIIVPKDGGQSSPRMLQGVRC